MGPMTVKVRALNKRQDEFSGEVFGRLEVIPCEVRAFWALLQDEIQLFVRHVDDLTVSGHLLDVLQNLHGSGCHRIDVFNAHVWAHSGNPLCNF